jgi:Phasin protein
MAQMLRCKISPHLAFADPMVQLESVFPILTGVSMSPTLDRFAVLQHVQCETFEKLVDLSLRHVQQSGTIGAHFIAVVANRQQEAFKHLAEATDPSALAASQVTVVQSIAQQALPHAQQLFDMWLATQAEAAGIAIGAAVAALLPSGTADDVFFYWRSIPSADMRESRSEDTPVARGDDKPVVPSEDKHAARIEHPRDARNESADASPVSDSPVPTAQAEASESTATEVPTPVVEAAPVKRRATASRNGPQRELDLADVPRRTSAAKRAAAKTSSASKDDTLSAPATAPAKAVRRRSSSPRAGRVK